MSNTVVHTRQPLIVLQFVAMGLVWGASFMFMKGALGGLSFGQLAWSREILGGVTLGIVMLIMRQRLPRRRAVWLHFVVIAVANAHPDRDGCHGHRRLPGRKAHR